VPANPYRGYRFPKLGDKWFLDEVKINGVQHYLWRAVDQHGAMTDIPDLSEAVAYVQAETSRDHHR
jgi:transposase-like protein